MRVNITTIKKKNIMHRVYTKLIQLTANKFRWFYRNNPRELLISITQRNSCAIHLLFFKLYLIINLGLLNRFLLLNLFVI